MSGIAVPQARSAFVCLSPFRAIVDLVAPVAPYEKKVSLWCFD